MTDIRRGLIIVNTGPGKGKTTAAMGTALRAVGNGMRVLMLQFLKGSWHYGELDSTQAFGQNFVLKQMGRGFVKVGGAETDPEDVRMVEAAWAEAREAILSGEWDMAVLDEINYPIGYGMLGPAWDPQHLRKRPGRVPLIRTGRHAFHVVEQNYDAGVVNQAWLLEKYEGKTINFQITPGQIVEGRIIRAGGPQGQPLIEVKGQVQFQLPGLPLFPAATDGLL